MIYSSFWATDVDVDVDVDIEVVTEYRSENHGEIDTNAMPGDDTSASAGAGAVLR